MAFATVTQNIAQYDSELFLIIVPVSATIASKTVIDSTLNVKLHGFGVNNITGTAATFSMTDGDGNKIITDASFDGAQVQFVECKPGYYMKNGIKITSDTDDALVIWFAVKKM